jgi:Skp family chaperone for outer membrane proteins
MKASWKTTALGIIAIISAVLAAIKSAMTAGIGSVNVGELVAAVSAGWGLIHARDNNVSSEQAGAK